MIDGSNLEILEARTRSAEGAYQGYDFGDGVVVEANGGWSYDGAGELTRRVYVVVESGGDHTVPLTFVARFQAKSQELLESYAIDMKGSIWGNQKQAAVA